jgi:hypothetical protein
MKNFSYMLWSLPHNSRCFDINQCFYLYAMFQQLFDI